MFPKMNGFKQEDVLMPFLFNIVLEYGVMRDQVNRDGWKWNGTHRLLVYADYGNILGGSRL